MRFAPRSVVRRAVAAAAATALLWTAMPPWSATAAVDAGRAAEPGTALAWGSNHAGHLGNGTSTSPSPPGPVCGGAPCAGPLDNVLAVSTRNNHSLALRADGSVWAWGDNQFGQLGDGTTDIRTTPVRVCAPGQTAPCGSFLTDVTAVVAGISHSLALRADGTVVAWGDNTQGRLGDGTTTPRSTPVAVCAVGAVAPCGTGNRLTNVLSLAASNHSLAVTADGGARAWGPNNVGQLGDGSMTFRTAPIDVPLEQSVTAVAAGNGHSLALQLDGTVSSWGGNGNGQLGDGTITGKASPVPVCAVGATAPCGTFLTGITAITAGSVRSAAVRSDRTVVAWGDNSSGQLGDGTISQRTTPVRTCAPFQMVPCSQFLSQVTALSAGQEHMLALQSDRSLLGWGQNTFSQIGDGTQFNRTTPVFVNVNGPAAVSAGNYHSLAITAPHADMGVFAAATPDSVASGAQVTYTLTLDNFGPDVAEGVVVHNTLPPGARFVSASTTRGSCQAPPSASANTVRCFIGGLGTGDLPTITIVAKAVAPAGTTITNTAVVSAATHDPAPQNNTAVIATPVT